MTPDVNRAMNGDYGKFLKVLSQVVSIALAVGGIIVALTATHLKVKDHDEAIGAIHVEMKTLDSDCHIRQERVAADISGIRTEQAVIQRDVQHIKTAVDKLHP